jgi:hypothetical protein
MDMEAITIPCLRCQNFCLLFRFCPTTVISHPSYMNRIQFFLLTGLSSLVVLLLVAHIFLARQTSIGQGRLNQAQQVLNQAQQIQNNLKQLAMRIGQDSQKDPNLKEVLTRQKITYNPASEGTNTTTSPGMPNATPTH